MHLALQTPSLQHVAGVKIVDHLWNQRDVFTRIAETFYGLPAYKQREDEKEWREIEDEVKSSVSVLPLPSPCKKQLSNFIKPLGMEIVAWCQYHNIDGYSFQFLDTLSPQQLRWTMRGTIDYTKTAELMVKDESLDAIQRYEIACINCLEDEAQQLFKFIPKYLRHRYVKGHLYCWSRETYYTLMAYFTCTLSHDVYQLNSLFRSRRNASVNVVLFKGALLKGNQAMSAYFFQKLSQREKEQLLVESEMKRFSLCGSRAACLRYYWSMTNAEQQRRMLRECTADALLCFLRWPAQSLFMAAAMYGWQFMNKNDCVKVLGKITRKIRFGFQDFDYAQLFWECWSLTSPDSKQHFLDDRDHLHDLFVTKEEDCIKLVFNEAPSHQLKGLLEIEFRYDRISQVLMDDSAISDAALMECKEIAALESSNDKEDEEKRWKSVYVSRFIDPAMEKRLKRRDII